MPNWKKIKAEYVNGGITYRALSEKYGISMSTLTKHAMTEGWSDLKQKTRKIIDKKLSESVANRKNATQDHCVDIADKLLKMIEAGIDDGSIAVTAKGLRDITGALKDIRDIKGIKNELDYQEQVARIEKLKREASADASAEPIKVVIAGTAEEFSE